MILYIFGINSEMIMRSGILIILFCLFSCTAGFSQVRESTDTTTSEAPAALSVTLSDTLKGGARVDTLEAVPADQPLQKVTANLILSGLQTGTSWTL